MGPSMTRPVQGSLTRPGGGSLHPALHGILEYWWLLAICAWLAAGLLYLTLPPSPDQFNHAYMGWRLLAGDRLYVDFIDVNWPGVSGLHALATWVFGVHLWSWRAFDFLMFALSAAFLVDLVRRAATPMAARICVLTSPLLYVAAGYWMSGQHDMSAAQFLVIALWFHVRGDETNRLRWQIGTGLALGLAMLNKPSVGAMLPLMLLQALLLGKPWVRVVVNGAVVTLAMLATIGTAVLAVLLSGTSLTELIDVTFVFLFSMQFADDPAARGQRLLQVLWWTHGRKWADLTLAALPALVWLLDRRRRSVATTSLLVLWVTGVLSYAIQGRGLAYHLAPSFLALVGFVAVAPTALAGGRLAVTRPLIHRLALAGLLLFVLLGQAYKFNDLYGKVPRAWLDDDWSHHLAHFRDLDGITFKDSVEFAARAKSESTTDCLLAVSEVSSINYLSQLRQPTRFYYFPVIEHTRAPMPMTERWLAAWAAELKSSDCRYVLVARRASEKWQAEPSPAADSLRELLRGYRESGTLGKNGGLVVYERN